MNRWKAAVAHLGISTIIAVVVVAAMRLLWYPGPYFGLMGGATLVVLIVGCDVALGPLLTLIIFKRGKKGLKMDLATIAAFQVVALAYGGYTMYAARPVFTVYVVDRFEVVAANEIQPGELAKATRPEFSSLSITGPRLVAARPPEDKKDSEAIMMQAVNGGDDVKQLPRLYVPYQQVASEAARHARPVTALERGPGSATSLIQQVSQRIGKPATELGYIPLIGRMRSMAAIVDLLSGEVYDTVPINPW